MITRSNPVGNNSVGFKSYFHFNSLDVDKLEEVGNASKNVGPKDKIFSEDGLFLRSPDGESDTVIIKKAKELGLTPNKAKLKEYPDLEAFKKSIAGKVEILDGVFK